MKIFAILFNNKKKRKTVEKYKLNKLEKKNRISWQNKSNSCN